MKKPDPKPCRCGCGRIVIPKRTTASGDWSIAMFYSDECRNTHRKKVSTAINKGEMKATPKKQDSKWWIHPIIDKFLYAKPRAV